MEDKDAIEWLWENHGVYISIGHRPQSQTFYYKVTGPYQMGNQGVLINAAFEKFNDAESAKKTAVVETLKFLMENLMEDLRKEQNEKT